jgi:hypothetical protein
MAMGTLLGGGAGTGSGGPLRTLATTATITHPLRAHYNSGTIIAYLRPEVVDRCWSEGVLPPRSGGLESDPLRPFENAATNRHRSMTAMRDRTL